MTGFARPSTMKSSQQTLDLPQFSWNKGSLSQNIEAIDLFMEDIINSGVYKFKWTIFAGFLFADHLSTQVSLWYFPGLQQQMGIHMTVDPSCLSHHSYSVGKEHVC